MLNMQVSWQINPKNGIIPDEVRVYLLELSSNVLPNYSSRRIGHREAAVRRIRLRGLMEKVI